MKSFLSFIWEVAKIVIISLLIVIPIRYFLFQPFFVKGQSMEPNFENGDYLIIDEISYRLRAPQRGEVIVFKYPENPSQRYIKRIAGLPGETIEIKDGEVIIFENNQRQVGEEDKSSSSPFAAARVLDESDYLSGDLMFINYPEITLGSDEYFVLGDNRGSTWRGVVPQGNIIGRVFFRAWPFTALAKIEAPSY